MEHERDVQRKRAQTCRAEGGGAPNTKWERRHERQRLGPRNLRTGISKKFTKTSAKLRELFCLEVPSKNLKARKVYGPTYVCVSFQMESCRPCSRLTNGKMKRKTKRQCKVVKQQRSPCSASCKAEFEKSKLNRHLVRSA